MTKAKKLIKAISTFLFVAVIATGCGEENSNNENQSSDPLENLVGKWEFEEMGIKMNIEILENNNFIWRSDYGSYDGKWAEKNDTIVLTPNDKLQSKIILVNDKQGKLFELTEENIKPIYTKIN